MLVLTLVACLISRDAYEERLAELQEPDPEPPPARIPDAPGIVVRALDAFGQPASGRELEVNGERHATDDAGLVWVAGGGAFVVRWEETGFASTGVLAEGVDGYSGATVEQVALSEATLARGKGTINVAGQRSVAFLDTFGAAAGDVVVPFAWAGGRAPAATDGDGDALDIYRAVFVGMPSGEAWTGNARWRERATGLEDLPGLALYRFDLGAGTWASVGPATVSHSWLEGELSEPGAWYAFAKPSPTGACPLVLAQDAATLVSLPGTELRARRSDLDASARSVTGPDGVACLAGQAASAVVDALRGVETDRRLAWFADGVVVELAAVATSGLPIAVGEDVDGDGVLAAPSWDCDDTRPEVRAGAADPAGDGDDANCDGVDGADRDGDGWPAEDDCEPGDPQSSPDGVEVCDGLDNDCDDSPDDGPMATTSDDLAVCLACEPQTVADLGPVVYFPFDDLSEGFAIDYSGWGRDLSETGDLSARWPGIADWDADAPYWIGDTETFLWLEDTDAFWPKTEMTVSIWLRPEYANRVSMSYQADREIHLPGSKTGDPSDFYALCDPEELSLDEFILHNQLTRTILKLADVQAEFTSEGAKIPLRGWTHLVAIRDGDAASLYVDGALAEEEISFVCEDLNGDDLAVSPYEMQAGGVLRIGQTMTAYPTAPDSPLEGGMTGVKAFEGVLDELAIFDRALTAAEVAVLFHATACDEGLSCDTRDDDSDLVTDEHLLGWPGRADCAAADCAAILATASEMGVGPYTLAVADEAWCDAATGETHYCGDGVVSALTDVAALESCDEAADPSTFPAGAASCDDCVADLPEFRDCQDVLDADPTAPDGAYRVDFDGAGPYPPVPVRCDMDGADAWTLVFAHDSRAGVLFNDPRDPDGLCAAAESDCTNGLDEGGKDLDTDIDCADPECWTHPACAVALPENMLCTDATNCACACPAKVLSGDNTTCLGPLGSKFSVVAYLDAFEGASRLVRYQLRWPFHEQTIGADALEWCQDWLPTEPREEGWCFDPQPSNPLAKVGFAGLAPHGLDLECVGAEDEVFAAFDGIEESSPTDVGCSNLFAIGLIQGNDAETSYGIPSNHEHGGDFSSKTVELWARRDSGSCPAPCAP